MLERPDLIDDQRFASNALRVANRAALDDEIEPAFASMELDEAITRLDAAQNAWGRVSEVPDLPRHKAMRRIEVALPDGRKVSVPKPSVRAAAFEAPPTVPALGADTERIRIEFAA